MRNTVKTVKKSLLYIKSNFIYCTSICRTVVILGWSGVVNLIRIHMWGVIWLHNFINYCTLIYGKHVRGRYLYVHARERDRQCGVVITGRYLERFLIKNLNEVRTRRDFYIWIAHEKITRHILIFHRGFFIFIYFICKYAITSDLHKIQLILLTLN